MSGYLYMFYFSRDYLLPSANLSDNDDTVAVEDSKKSIEKKETEILVSYPVDQALDQVCSLIRRDMKKLNIMVSSIRTFSQIFCRIIDEYISRWYCDISSDPWFQYEARSAIRRITVAICERITRVSC